MNQSPIPHDYYYGSEAEQYTFYRFPKALFTNNRYKAMSDSAKILYGLMFDRMGLSLKNGWLDTVKHKAIQQLRFNGKGHKAAIGEQGFGYAVKGKLAGFQLVEVIKGWVYN